MLVLTLTPDNKVEVHQDGKLFGTVYLVKTAGVGRAVRLGFDFPKDVRIHREENKFNPNSRRRRST